MEKKKFIYILSRRSKLESFMRTENGRKTNFYIYSGKYTSHNSALLPDLLDLVLIAFNTEKCYLVFSLLFFES